MKSDQNRLFQIITPSDGHRGLLSQKTHRNQRCSCESGKKSKNCCGAGTKYYNREKTEIITQEKAEE